ncbi:MAG: STAS domain-containing protein [Actinomycetota bacterium]
MTPGALTLDVRNADEAVSLIDVSGDITAESEEVLMDAYNQASQTTTTAVVLNFTGLEYMNSGGIGLLVTLLVRANRQKQKLLAFGLTEHYKQIFELTRIDEAIGIYGSEEEALAAAGG